MNKEEAVKRTQEYIRGLMLGESSGHDWWHVYRVWQNTIYIGTQERADLFVAELTALLHDIADWKFHDGDDTVGPRLAAEWLNKLGVERGIIDSVTEAISLISFKNRWEDKTRLSLEAKVVQDADRLDAMGAIGIGRTFAYGGYKGREMYDPEILPQNFTNSEQYMKSVSPTINHFYEKLLLLKDLMNTPTAGRLAQERHDFMLAFLDQFFREWRITEQNTAQD